MQDTSTRIDNIIDAVQRSSELRVLEPVEIGEGTRRNELLFFVKPEVFLVQDSSRIVSFLNLVFGKLNDFQVGVDGIVAVGGAILNRLQIMDRHYGFINQLSRSASTVLNKADRNAIADALHVDLGNYRILGGHEYLAQYTNENSADLDAIWFAEKSTKLRSGFYVRKVEKDHQNIVLVNGFHPAQLEHFTADSHRMLLMLLHSDTPWASLRGRMVGTTFPEEAAPESIRGTLYANKQEYGFESVSIANNAVHLSAGPFEGMFEIVNFFGRMLGIDPREKQPLVLKRMIQQGASISDALAALTNPTISTPQGVRDLFSSTEDLDTDAAIELWKHGSTV